MTSSPPPNAKPVIITGGCLCSGLRYTVSLSASHDFSASAVTCQCTQCRRQSGALFVAFHRVPWPLRWTTPETPTLQEFSITPVAKRGFCSACGSWLYYRSEGQGVASICVGTVDEEVLIGNKGSEGAREGEGLGKVLVNGLGGHEWCENEIPGVTDDVPLLRRGRRSLGSLSE
ncbi:hypothetical protein CCHL11_00162 [Colletotrichum chlorophyti]|uniref:CENP-V/GFA domain-containing protein n=1 Tax=Colletotrichum chlorophyti TaxID=708187 RepID=A0A1Q8RU66_9PEZI|nr:hypothetical protein CCHL11_00162 [Colletotrichum chlorophyti]